MGKAYIITVINKGDEKTSPITYCAVASEYGERKTLETGQEQIHLREAISGVEHVFVTGIRILKPSVKSYVDKIIPLKEGMTLDEQCAELSRIYESSNISIGNGYSKRRAVRTK